MNLVRVICSVPGFRRAGRAWPAECVVDMDDFSAAEWQAIEGEAQLEARVLSNEEQPPRPGGRPSGGGELKSKARKKAARKSTTRGAS